MLVLCRSQQEFQSHIRDDADNNGDHGNLPALRHGDPKQFFRCLMMSRPIVSSFAAAISRERLWYFALAVAPRGPQMHGPTGHRRSTLGRRPPGLNGVSVAALWGSEQSHVGEE